MINFDSEIKRVLENFRNIWEKDRLVIYDTKGGGGGGCGEACAWSPP